MNKPYNRDIAYIMDEYYNKESKDYTRETLNGPRPRIVRKSDLQYRISAETREMMIRYCESVIADPTINSRHKGIATKNLHAMQQFDLATMQSDTTAPQQIQVEIIRTPPANQ